MRRASVLIGILVFLVAGSAPTRASDVLTLEESIKIAVQRSLLILSAEEEVKAKEFEERSSKADFYPKFSTNYSYNRLYNDAVDGLAASGLSSRLSLQRDTYEFNLTGTQPLFTGWRITRVRELAALGVDIANIQKETVIQDLVLNVKAAYFGILKAEKLGRVAMQAVEQLKANLRVAQAFYDEGITAKNDLLQTEVEMAQARQDLITATNRLEIARSLFNKLLRRELNTETKVKDILDYRPVTLALEQCLETARLNRTEIKEVSLNVLSAEKSVELTKSAYYPTVSLAGNYQRKADNAFLEADPGEDPDYWTLLLKGEWTFWEWGKKKDDVGAARARLAKTKYILKELEDTIGLEVKEAYLSLGEAEKNIQVAKTAVVQAEENFRMNEERYKQQVATSTDVLNAQTLLTRARTNYFNALSENNIAWARLERAMAVGYRTE